MRLTRLTASGLHGGAVPNIEVNLTSDVLLVTGSNEAGKTTTITLPELILAGPTGKRWPVLGESPGYDCEATADFVNGDARRVTVIRGIERGTHWASFDGRPGKLKSVQEKISAALGEAYTFNLADFTGMTAGKRLAWMEARILGTGGWDAERLAHEIAAAQLDERFNLLGLALDGEHAPRDGLVRLIAAAKSARLDVRREKTRLTAAVAQQKTETDAEGLPVGTVPEWRGKLSTLQGERAQLAKAQGRIQGAKDALGAHVKAQEATAAAIETAQKKISDSLGAQVVKDEEIDRLRALVTEAAAAYEPVHTALLLAATAAERERADYAAALAEGVTAKSVRAAAWAAVAVVEASQTDLDRVLVGSGARRLYERVAEAGRGVVELACRLPDDSASLAAAAAEEEAKAPVRAAKRTLDAAKKQQQQAEKDLARLQREEAAGRVDVTRLQAQAAELAEAQIAAGETTGEDGLTDALEVIRVQAEEAEGAIDRLTDAAAAKALTMQRQMELEIVERKRVAALELEKALTTILERMLTEAVQPFLAPINAITQDVMGTDAYADLAGGFDFGVVRDDGTRVPWGTCSESQQTALLLAFSIAVQGRLGGAWRRLVVDGLECMDADRRTRFMLAMRACLDRGELDTLICASVADGWEPPAEALAQVVTLGREA